MASNSVVEFSKVTKNYTVGVFRRRQVQAVAGVSFRIEPGEVFGLLGPNRAGKTTLLKMLLSLCQPTGGRVTRFGRPVSDRRTLGRVGYIHENPAFPRYLTATGLLEFYGALALVPYEDVCQRVPRLLERVGLADRRNEPISNFSKGMVQRLAVAQALLNEPDLLVLDEPNEGLDLIGRKLVSDIVREFRQQGRTVLLVSHVPLEIERLCDRVAVILGGRLSFLGRLDELKRDKSNVAVPLEQALEQLYRNSST